MRNQVINGDNHGHYQQDMDKCTSNMYNQTQQPENEEDNDYRPEKTQDSHDKSPIFLPIFW
jgi:hypothetical protein